MERQAPGSPCGDAFDGSEPSLWLAEPLFCWLIRKFIDPDAAIRYADRARDDEIAFDMREAKFGHQGNRCSFETLLGSLSLHDPALRVVAEIVHEIDLRDDLYQRAEVSGVDAILQGWLLADYTDAELESHGVALFAGLYDALKERTESSPKPVRQEPSEIGGAV